MFTLEPIITPNTVELAGGVAARRIVEPSNAKPLVGAEEPELGC